MNPKDIDPAELARMMTTATGELKDYIQCQTEASVELRQRVHELEQKIATRRTGGGSEAGGADNEFAELITQSDGVKAFLAGNTQSCQITVPGRHLKTFIINATGQNQPLVPADRRPGIVYAPQQRMTIRAVLAAYPTNSNLIEWPSEATYTSNARPQGDSSPGGIEAEPKAESGFTFQLNNTPVVTLAHWVAASRQILSDAPMLQGHLSSRLLYGLALEEETEILTGTGAAGKLNGLINQASAFRGGVTNQTALDTLAKAANQLSTGNYSPSAFILHPTDWLNIKLTKDSTGRYILGDPASATLPMLWGLPVVPTPSMTLGKFLCLDAARTGYIADREEAVIRISENVNDHFIRNLIAILAEERVALVVENGAAMCYGDVSNAG